MIRVLVSWIVGIVVGLMSLFWMPYTSSASSTGTITVRLGNDMLTAIASEPEAVLQLTLLADDDDLLADIETLREQSKLELEPLMKRYMYAADALVKLSSDADLNEEERQERTRLHEVYQNTDAQIQSILNRYRGDIEHQLRTHTLDTATLSLKYSDVHTFQCRPGRYRMYAVLTFSTTTLTWFDAIIVQGGDRHSLKLTREGLMNPFWTDLDWWSFINLDFSKHHF